MKEVKVVAKRSDGEVFDYTNADWGLVKLEGVDFPPVEIFKENRGFGNGSIITGKRKGARGIDLKAISRKTLTNETDRMEALAFHNTNYTYELHITYMGTTRIAKNCEIEGAKCPSGNVYARQELTVSYLAVDADLYAENENDTLFITETPLWHVTRAYPSGGGTLAYGVIAHESEQVIHYLGSEEAPIIVTVHSKGYVDGINIQLGSLVIAVDKQLTGGDLLVVDAEKRLVTLNGVKVGEDGYNSVDLPKLVLKYGDNIVSVTAKDPNNVAFDAEVKYTGRYGGI